MRIAVVGIGMGPQHVTPEAAAVLRASSYVVAAEKRGGDPLLAVRRQVAALHGLDVVAVPDPPRDRDPAGSRAYVDEVRGWHAARADAWARTIGDRGGDPAFLVWGDPSLYDSTLRVVDDVAARLGAEVRAVAGVSAPSLLAARFGIVLHEVGQPVHVTTARRLRDDLAAGQRNVVVMLGAEPDLAGLEDWCLWWGANLGTDGEVLVHGRVGAVADEVAAARERARSQAGWVLDVYLLRGPAS